MHQNAFSKRILEFSLKIFNFKSLWANVDRCYKRYKTQKIFWNKYFRTRAYFKWDQFFRVSFLIVEITLVITGSCDFFARYLIYSYNILLVFNFSPLSTDSAAENGSVIYNKMSRKSFLNLIVYFRMTTTAKKSFLLILFF
jgi:hypothetical protein